MAAHSARSILRPPGGAALLRAGSAAVTEPFGNSATRAPRSGLTWRQYSPTRALVSVVTTSLPAYPTMLATRWSRWVLLSTSRYTVPGWTNWCRLGIPAVASPAAAGLQVGGRQRGWSSPRRRATPSGAWLHETFTVATVDASWPRSTLEASGQTGR